jgi:hypothetical protein
MSIFTQFDKCTDTVLQIKQDYEKNEKKQLWIFMHFHPKSWGNRFFLNASIKQQDHMVQQFIVSQSE